MSHAEQMAYPGGLRRARERAPRTRWSWRIGSVGGTAIRLHGTFLILLAWLALEQLLGGESFVQLVARVALLSVVFGCVFLHELGHAMVARRYGIETREIVLLPVGGIARMDRLPDKPRAELAIAIAGPAVNLVIAGALFAVQLFGVGAVATLAWINVSLALFNLLPAFPMDGGRVLRALLTAEMGRASATRISARVGQVLALGLALAAPWVSPMLFLVALVVYWGAETELAMVTLQTALEGLEASQAMVHARTIGSYVPLGRAAARLMSGSERELVVVDAKGAPIGLVSPEAIAAHMNNHGPWVRVVDVMERDIETVDAAELLSGIVDRLGPRPIVVTRDGRVSGMITDETITRLLLLTGRLGEEQAA
jgi:Zn-dependent protease